MNRLSSLLACGLLALPFAAEAGGIVTDGHGAKPASVPRFDREFVDLTRFLPPDPRASADVAPPPPAPGPRGDDELAQIHAGLITVEEAESGCGGASAAPGGASVAGLVLGALALTRRRR